MCCMHLYYTVNNRAEMKYMLSVGRFSPPQSPHNGCSSSVRFFCILDELLLSIYDDDGFLVSDRFQLAIVKYENCICHC